MRPFFFTSLGMHDEEKKEEERRKGRHGRREIVFVSMMLMMPDITVPLGISHKRYAASIRAYQLPVYRLLDHIIILCVCVHFCILNIRHTRRLFNESFN